MKSLAGFFALTVFSLLLVNPSHADLVAHWKGNGTTADSSGNGHHASWSSTPSYAAGHVGQAFAFDGSNNFLSVPGNAALEPAEFSMSLWFSAPDIFAQRLLVDSSHGWTNGPFGWAIQMTSDGRLSFAYGNGSTFPELQSSAGWDDGTFHHLVATLDATNNMRIYLDGNLNASTTFTGTPMGTGLDILMGRHFGLDRQYTGLLDDVRLFNHALDQSEVDALFAVPEPASLIPASCMLLGCILIRRRKVKSKQPMH